MDIVKGSSVKFSLTVYIDDAATTLANLTGATIKLMVKNRITDPDASALVDRTGVVTDAVNGLAEVVMLAADSMALNYFSLKMEIVVKLSDGSYIRTGPIDLHLIEAVKKTLF